jgi:hypothetical protein
MIAHANKLRVQALHDRFLDMLPSIRQQARFAFRAETPERRDDLVTEVIGSQTSRVPSLLSGGGPRIVTVCVPWPERAFRERRHSHGARRSDTPTQIRPYAKTAVYWGEKRRRNDDIRSLTCQSRSALGERVLPPRTQSPGTGQPHPVGDAEVGQSNGEVHCRKRLGGLLRYYIVALRQLCDNGLRVCFHLME